MLQRSIEHLVHLMVAKIANLRVSIILLNSNGCKIRYLLIFVFRKYWLKIFCLDQEKWPKSSLSVLRQVPDSVDQTSTAETCQKATGVQSVAAS